MPDVTGFQVQARPCSTCIYKPSSPLDIRKLEAEISDGYGGFKSYRICHHSKNVCCHGFWSRHKDQFPSGQIAQRLGCVQFVTEDRLA
jgi:hypothetical protein